MCIIIHKPAGIKLGDDIYEECRWRHQHGVGFCYVENGRLVVQKDMWTLKGFMAALEPHHDKEMVIHFRNASPATPIDKDNCHPFQFTTGITDEAKEGEYEWAVSHNGKLSWRTTKTQSDTNCFVHDYLMHFMNLHPDFLEDEDNIDLMRRLINPEWVNKIVIMRVAVATGESKVYIINDKAGAREKGCWFSNETFRPWCKGSESDFGGAYCPPPKGGRKITVHDFSAFSHDPIDDHVLKRMRYTQADQHGWRWDYTEDIWHNVDTNMKLELLLSRVPPYGPATYAQKNRDRHLAWLETAMPTWIPGSFPKQHTPEAVTADLKAYRLFLLESHEANKKKQQEEAAKKAEDDKKNPSLLALPSPLPNKGSPATSTDVRLFAHLTHPMTELLLSEARRNYADLGYARKEWKKLKGIEQIADLRCRVVESMPELADMDAESLDLWICSRAKDGILWRMIMNRDIVNLKREEKLAANVHQESFGDQHGY